MVSFELSGGEEAVRAFFAHLKLFSLAESLGGVESLICHPASMTHASLSNETLKKAGLSQSLIRVSVGIESADDLLADVLAALEAATHAVKLKTVA
jgi:cystathionine gamma-synthase